MKKSFNVTIKKPFNITPKKNIIDFIEKEVKQEDLGIPIEGEVNKQVDGINANGEVIPELAPAVVEVIQEQPKIQKQVDQLYAHNLAYLTNITDLTKRVLDLLVNTSPDGMFISITDDQSINTFNSSLNEIIISKLQSHLGVTSL